ncbi:hypothetical protein [Paractinoplanes rishiriensis]|uniref:hypothetical protein n=1 Tax=Paractinoplanes rishiriensis TaxID=1050105 RepID=UPI001942DC5E|nr:hypothetical protein [Actinoplanes rishiriensis]
MSTATINTTSALLRLMPTHCHQCPPMEIPCAMVIAMDIEFGPVPVRHETRRGEPVIDQILAGPDN